jgi:hypothetical protein
VNPHRIEGRSNLLAQRVVQRRDALAGMLRAPDDRPLFTQQMPDGEALEWWRRHRNDPLGKKVIDRWMTNDPNQGMLTLANLDQALSRKLEADGFLPQEPDAAP